MNHYRRILRYVRPYRGVFALAIVGMLIVASTDVMMLRIVQPLLNNIGAVDAESTWWLPFALVGVFLLRGVGSYVSDYGLAWIGSRVVFDLRCEASEHLLRLPTPYYDATSAGFLLSKITFDAQQIAATASEAITVAIRNTLTIAFMLAYLLYINWQLTLIAFAAFPLIGLRAEEDQPAPEARERARPGAHRRAHARAGGGDRRAPHRQGVRRRALRERAAARTRRTGCGSRWRSSPPPPRSARRSTRSSSPSRSA